MSYCQPRKVFLSYARADRKRADAVKMLLELGGAQVFMDWQSIGPGAKWESALLQALGSCDTLCVFWSREAERSKWVRAEYTAFITAFPDRPCVPLCADTTPLPSSLSMHQAPSDFLHLANVFLALRRDLLEQGVDQHEIRRIVRARLAATGLQLDNVQMRRLLGLFATGISLALLMAWLPKPIKMVIWAICIIVVGSVTWHISSSTSSRHDAMGTATTSDATSTTLTTAFAGGSSERDPPASFSENETDPPARKDAATSSVPTDAAALSISCDSTNTRDPRCSRSRETVAKLPDAGAEPIPPSDRKIYVGTNEDKGASHSKLVFIYFNRVKDETKLALKDDFFWDLEWPLYEQIRSDGRLDIQTRGYANADAFVITPIIKRIRFTNHDIDILCNVEFRLAFPTGNNGDSRRPDSRVIVTTGEATTNASRRWDERAISECLQSATKDVTQRRIIPLLLNVAAAQPVDSK